MESALRKIQDKLQANLSSIAALKKIGGGARFFGTTKRGESVELANDLNGQDKEKQKNAVKRVIANMTLGRDVSQLFADVVKLGQTTNLELKKLVYLYVLNTAKLQPDKALMAVNTFLQDIQHASPIVRALSLRTMLCVRVECVTEYTLEPLRRAFSDPDPYVRKTAAIGLGKLFHQNPRLFEEQGFIDNLLELLSDIPIVAANAAVILAEVRTFSTVPVVLQPPKVNGNRLLTALAECNEWGQVYILELLSGYIPAGQEEGSSVVERVAPRLSSGNPAVALGAVKVMATMFIRYPELDKEPYLPRMNAAMLSLAKADHETQFVALRNIAVLLELFPTLLSESVESFFLRFTDPTYLKVEKLQLILRVISRTTATRVMSELTEYSNEVDVTFVKDVISAVATTCIKCDNVASQTINLLLSLARRRPEMLPAIITATKNIVRKYPDLVMDLLVPLLKDHGADAIETEEAKSSFVWMLGEFCDVIESGETYLQQYLETFVEQETSVQLSLLTAVVKIFLRNPARMEATLNHVLEVATTNCEDPDLRDRAWMYWRLLAKGIGVEKMKRIVHGRKPPMELERKFGDIMTTAEIAGSLNTVAATYARPYRSFLPSYGVPGDNSEDYDDEDEGEPEEATVPQSNIPQPNYNANMRTAAPVPGPAPAPTPAPAPAPAYVDPLNALFSPTLLPSSNNTQPQRSVIDPFEALAPPPTVAPAPQPASQGLFQPAPSQRTDQVNPFDSVFGNPQQAAPTSSGELALPQVVDPLQNAGLGISCLIQCSEEPYNCLLQLNNRGRDVVSDFAMQFNKNIFGFVPAAAISDVWPNPRLAPGESKRLTIPVRSRESHFDETRSAVQVGIKTNLGLATFFINIQPNSWFLVSPTITPQEFAAHWKAMDSSVEVKQQLPAAVVRRVNADPAGFKALLGQHRFFVVVNRDLEKTHAFYGAVKTHTGISCLFELLIAKDGQAFSTLSIKNPRASEVRALILSVLDAIAALP